MLSLCRDQGIAVTPFSPLARGLLSGAATSLRNTTDQFTADQFTAAQYGDQTSFDIAAAAVARIAQARGMTSSQMALNRVTNRPGVTSTLVGVETAAQLGEQIAALDLQLTPAGERELGKLYTPPDVINDHNFNRIPRMVPPPRRCKKRYTHDCY